MTCTGPNSKVKIGERMIPKATRFKYLRYMIQMTGRLGEMSTIGSKQGG